MSQKKVARTQIADLPETARELSAAELDQVAGGMFASLGGAALNAPISRVCGTCEPGSSTLCCDTDYIHD